MNKDLKYILHMTPIKNVIKRKKIKCLSQITQKKKSKIGSNDPTFLFLSYKVQLSHGNSFLAAFEIVKLQCIYQSIIGPIVSKNSMYMP